MKVQMQWTRLAQLGDPPTTGPPHQAPPHQTSDQLLDGLLMAYAGIEVVPPRPQPVARPRPGQAGK